MGIGPHPSFCTCQLPPFPNRLTRPKYFPLSQWTSKFPKVPFHRASTSIGGAASSGINLAVTNVAPPLCANTCGWRLPDNEIILETLMEIQHEASKQNDSQIFKNLVVRPCLCSVTDHHKYPGVLFRALAGMLTLVALLKMRSHLIRRRLELQMMPRRDRAAPRMCLHFSSRRASVVLSPLATSPRL